MQIVSGIATHTEPEAVAVDLAQQLAAGLNNHHADLLMLFVTAGLQTHAGEIAHILRDRLKPRNLVGCTAESVSGGAREIEQKPAASALALSLPGVTIDTFHFAEEEWQELLTEEGTLRARLEAGPELRAFIMLADPFSTPVLQLLTVCTALFPDAPIIGGMASGMAAAGEVRLIIDEQVHSSGLVGVSFAGPLQVDCVVSQGCRPVGEPYVITKGRKNIIEHLNGKPALQALEEMISSLPLVDRELLQAKGLQIGRVIDEGKGNLGRGDFLIRSLVDVNKETGAIAIGEPLIRVGQTIQFHVRDAITASDDLRLLLEGELLLASPPAGALLFSCTGRGSRLFDKPNHDISVTHRVLGDAPTAGMFCAGELGPVGNRNFIHGHTASLALFRAPDGNQP